MMEALKENTSLQSDIMKVKGTFLTLWLDHFYSDFIFCPICSLLTFFSSYLDNFIPLLLIQT